MMVEAMASVWGIIPRWTRLVFLAGIIEANAFYGING